MLKRTIFLVKWSILMLAITSCTKFCTPSRSSMSPEQMVEGYLNTALNMTDVSERRDLLEYTTGALKAAITQAPDEVIKAAYIDRKYKLQSYSVVERRDRTPRETEITFRLTYLDLGSNGTADAATSPKVTTENTVAVVRENKEWLIRDVLGNKTAVDFPVAPESQINAKPGPGIDQPQDKDPATNQ